ncbi:MAG: esterase [Polyangiales bacterium]
MKTLQLGPVLVRACGGTDGDGGGDGPSIVLSHGEGAPGDDRVALPRGIDVGRGVRWFFPEAPLKVDVGPGAVGRAWWPIDMAKIQLAIMTGKRRDMIDDDPPTLATAREALAACLDALVKDHALDPARALIGGFSQGAMLSTEVVLERDEALPAFAGLVVMSGSMLAAPRWSTQIEARARGLHVLQSHGQADPLIPFEAAMALHDKLRAAGAAIELVSFRGQHEIPPAVLQRLALFARARLGT